MSTKNDQRYFELLYPGGVPEKDNCEGPPTYQFYDEADVPDTGIKILFYTEKSKDNREVGRYKYAIMLAVVEQTEGELTVMNKKEVSLILTGDREAYYPYRVEGVIGHFKVSDELDAVHIDHTTGWVSDFFLLDRDEFSLKRILWIDHTANCIINKDIEELKEENTVLAYRHDSEYTHVYFADVDDDGTTEILTRKRFCTRDFKAKTTETGMSPSIDVYKFSTADEQYLPAGQISELPLDAVEFRRVNLPCSEDDFSMKDNDRADAQGPSLP